MCTLCGEGWRVEATELATGRVKAVLHPVEMSWEVPDSAVGTGSIVVATRDPSAADIWPHTTGVYISRVRTNGTRYGHFGGLIEKFSGSAGGATTLGLQSIEEYLFHRLLATDSDGLVYTTAASGVPLADEAVPTLADQKQQTQVARDLVQLTAIRGLQGLIPIAMPSTKMVYVGWNKWDFKNIGEAIRELVEKVDGLRYKLEHNFSSGYWTTNIRFSDTLGTDRDYTLRSDHEGWGYSLEIDAKSQASRVYGIGASDQDEQMFSIAYDVEAQGDPVGFPEFHASPAWKDINVPATLDDWTRGYVTNFRDPVATPGMTLVGIPSDDEPLRGWPGPEILETGDRFGVEIGYGVITFRGERARLLSQSYKVQVDEPVQRTLALLPLIRPSLSVMTQVPAKALTPDDVGAVPTPLQGNTPVTVDPCDAPGELCRVQSTQLTEISGMQYSWTNPGHVWVHNDEDAPQDDGQVFLVSLADGKKKGSYNVQQKGLGPLIDPEAIRRTPDGYLMLGDIGDNDRTRNHVRIYAVAEPVGGGAKGVLPTLLYRLQYPGGVKRNAECLLSNPTTGEVIIISKSTVENGGIAYSFGNALVEGAAGMNVGTIKATGLPAGISDGTFTNDGRYILLRVAGVKPTLMYSASTWEKVTEISTPAMSKSEAITIEGSAPDPCGFLVTTETKDSGGQAPIYRVLMPGKTTGNAGGGSSGGEPTPGGAAIPSQLIDLTNWKLTLPY